MVKSDKKQLKKGVIFALLNGDKINLEERKAKDKSYFDYTLIPGGGIEKGETAIEALLREVNEEYGVLVDKYQELGVISNLDENGIENNRRIYLVTKWKGVLSNPEGKNGHVEATLKEARKLCIHPVSQKILDMIEKELSGNNR